MSCGNSARAKKKTAKNSCPAYRRCKPGNTYDACLIADFDDLEALSRYKNDPRHVAVSTLCKSIRESRGAIDYNL